MLIIELILLIIWHSVAPFQSYTVIPDPIRPAFNYDACYYNQASQTMFYISLSFKIATLLCGCILIFKARNVPSDFNETQYLILTIYSVAFSSAILIPVVATDALNHTNCFIVRSFGIMCAVLIGGLTLIVPKLFTLYIHGVDAKISQATSGSSDSTNTNINQRVQQTFNAKSIRDMTVYTLESTMTCIQKELTRRHQHHGLDKHKRDSIPSSNYQSSMNTTSFVHSSSPIIGGKGMSFDSSPVVGGKQVGKTGDSYQQDSRRSSQIEQPFTPVGAVQPDIRLSSISLALTQPSHNNDNNHTHNQTSQQLSTHTQTPTNNTTTN
jgi:hypothetical protein